jgi:hypothetical protein
MIDYYKPSPYRGFGHKSIDGFHAGKDYDEVKGTEINFPENMTILSIKCVLGYGGMHPNKYGYVIFARNEHPTKPMYIQFGHVLPSCLVGDFISAGIPFAKIGEFWSGHDNLPHLHLGLSHYDMRNMESWGYVSSPWLLSNFISPEKYFFERKRKNELP